MSVNLREWQYKDTLDERDKVWGLLGLALQSMQNLLRDCYPYEKNPNMRGGTLCQEGTEPRTKKEVEHPRSAEGWVEGTCADPWPPGFELYFAIFRSFIEV